MRRRSGTPQWPVPLEAVRRIRAWAGSALSVIGVGGIDSPERARQMLDSGADLIQKYTGLIYKGPGLPASILNALEAHTTQGHQSAGVARGLQRLG